MKIEHVALWTRNLERSKAFYETYFGGAANKKYTNPLTGLESYFVRFGGDTRLELMSIPGIQNHAHELTVGWAHIAISVGSKAAVDELTNRLRAEGYAVASEPRLTGDGHYESVILDPDGNRVEITI